MASLSGMILSRASSTLRYRYLSYSDVKMLVLCPSFSHLGVENPRFSENGPKTTPQLLWIWGGLVSCV